MKKHIKDKDGRFWKVIDLETGEDIKNCFWANDKTGEYKINCTNKEGEFIFEDEDKESLKAEMRKGKIKLINIRNKKEISNVNI